MLKPSKGAVTSKTVTPVTPIMERSKVSSGLSCQSRPFIDPNKFGVSFSLKQCRSFDIDPIETLDWLIHDAGFRRYRLMSYWNEHEKQPGVFDFTRLDAQVAAIAAAGGVITLCLGARQPRWPENHWPTWAWKEDKSSRSQHLLRYVQAVVLRYKDQPAIMNYQLENEALLTDFGERSEVDVPRLRAEYALIKRLDPSRDIVMTTSTSWGIPVHQPIPDVVGFSYYHTLYRKGAYHRSNFIPAFHRVRKLLIRALHHKPVFVHELQLEPWGPANIWEMPVSEQDKSMSPEQITVNVRLARKIGANPVDLWGGEWWYWRFLQRDDQIWRAVKKSVG